MAKEPLLVELKALNKEITLGYLGKLNVTTRVLKMAEGSREDNQRERCLWKNGQRNVMFQVLNLDKGSHKPRNTYSLWKLKRTTHRIR